MSALLRFELEKLSKRFVRWSVSYGAYIGEQTLGPMLGNWNLCLHCMNRSVITGTSLKGTIVWKSWGLGMGSFGNWERD